MFKCRINVFPRTGRNCEAACLLYLATHILFGLKSASIHKSFWSLTKVYTPLHLIIDPRSLILQNAPLIPVWTSFVWAACVSAGIFQQQVYITVQHCECFSPKLAEWYGFCFALVVKLKCSTTAIFFWCHKYCENFKRMLYLMKLFLSTVMWLWPS